MPKIIPSLALLLGLGLAGAASASIDFSLLPASTVAQPGDTVTVELTVVNESDPFNGYDARVAYDADRLVFLQMEPVTAQEGPLMTEACPNRFHIFTIGPDSTYLEVNHVLLCAGTTVTGPGVVYRLQFVCGDEAGPTQLDFTDFTHFYDDGYYVTPLNLTGAVIDIQGAVSAPESTPTRRESLQAAPNPFNPQTVLSFALSRDGRTRLTVFDGRGRRVRTLVRGSLPAGSHSVTWHGRDDAGRPVGSGTYLVRLEGPDGLQHHRITLIK